jgi:hypothetical protein
MPLPRTCTSICASSDRSSARGSLRLDERVPTLSSASSAAGRCSQSCRWVRRHGCPPYTRRAGPGRRDQQATNKAPSTTGNDQPRRARRLCPDLDVRCPPTVADQPKINSQAHLRPARSAMGAVDAWGSDRSAVLRPAARSSRRQSRRVVALEPAWPSSRRRSRSGCSGCRRRRKELDAFLHQDGYSISS